MPVKLETSLCNFFVWCGSPLYTLKDLKCFHGCHRLVYYMFWNEYAPATHNNLFKWNFDKISHKTVSTVNIGYENFPFRSVTHFHPFRQLRKEKELFVQAEWVWKEESPILGIIFLFSLSPAHTFLTEWVVQRF